MIDALLPHDIGRPLLYATLAGLSTTVGAIFAVRLLFTYQYLPESMHDLLTPSADHPQARPCPHGGPAGHRDWGHVNGVHRRADMQECMGP